MQPINYGVQIADPTQTFLGAFQTGASIQEARLRQEQQQQQMANQKLIQQGLAKLRQPGATTEDVSNLAMILPKDQSETVIKAWALKTDAQKQNSLNQAGKVVSAFFAGENDIAQQLINDQAVAMRNSGNEEGAKFLETWRGVTEVNPTASQNFFTAELLRLPGGEKIVENIVKLNVERRAEALQPSALKEAIAKAEKAVADATTAQQTAKNAPEKAAADAALAKAQADKAKVESQFAERQQLATLEKSNWDVRNLKSQISDRSAQLNLKTQEVAATVAEKLASVGQKLNEVPADTKKLINESAVAAATSKQSAGQFNDLAKRLESEGGGYGVFSSASDYLKRGVGFQGGMTQLRQEYTRLRNTAAIKSLPPGPATDKDIALALRGFPSETASASDLSSFLRGMAKLQDIDASINNAKTDWLTNNNGSLARAKTTFVAGDYAAKAGENFNDFSTRIIDDVTKKYDPRTQTSLVEQIPTPRSPQPMAAQNNIRSAADAILSGGQ
jgi:hypothetical protein